MIELLALDLDDTLLRADLSISDKNQDALKQAEEKGVRIVLSSGRTTTAMNRYAELLGMMEKPGYMICDNGSSVWSTFPFKNLVNHTLNKSLLDELFDAFDEFNLPVQVYNDKTIMVTKENPISSVDLKLSGQKRIVVQDLKKTLDFAPRKLVIPGDPEKLMKVLPLIRKRFGNQINSFISKPFFLEVLPYQADKGTALSYVAEQAGIPKENVMALGDAANDLGMISWAGWGVAMANAIPEVKAAARITTSRTNEEDGVAEMIEKYILI